MFRGQHIDAHGTVPIAQDSDAEGDGDSDGDGEGDGDGNRPSVGDGASGVPGSCGT